MLNSVHPQKILIVRTDRIGDVVLSLPMIPTLRSAFPESSISFLLRSYTKDIATGQKGLDEILLYDENGVQKPFFRMLMELRQSRFDAVIITYPTIRLAWLMRLSGIPLRVGTGYRWYSFLMNWRIFEHRKTAEKHESEYNLSLLRGLGIQSPDSSFPHIAISDEARNEASKAIAGLNMSDNGKLIVLHPGSGGSARDWSPEHFGELAQRLHSTERSVLVTGGPGEKTLVERTVKASGGTAESLKVPLSLKALAALLEQTDAFVSNSTGPLHIAAAVGTPVVAFYPPIVQCSSVRWGPLTEKKIIFEPSSSDCPRCRGGECQGNDCLNQITPEVVAREVEQLLHKYERRRPAFQKI